MSKRITKYTLSIAAACIAGGLSFGTLDTRAEDMAMQKPDAAMSADMAKMKMMMQDPAAMASMKASMNKMAAMDKMASELAKDPECKAMCEKMMAADSSKPDSMMATPEQMKMAKDEIMKDPEAMKMVSARAMMMMMNMNKTGMKMDMDGGMKGTAKEMKPMGGDMKK